MPTEMRLVAGLHRPSFDLQPLRRLAGPLTLVIALRKQPLARFSDVPSRMLARDDVGGENRGEAAGRDRPRSPGLCTRGRIERSCYQTHNAGYLKG